MIKILTLIVGYSTSLCRFWFGLVNLLLVHHELLKCILPFMLGRPLIVEASLNEVLLSVIQIHLQVFLILSLSSNVLSLVQARCLYLSLLLTSSIYLGV